MSLFDRKNKKGFLADAVEKVDQEELQRRTEEKVKQIIRLDERYAQLYQAPQPIVVHVPTCTCSSCEQVRQNKPAPIYPWFHYKATFTHELLANLPPSWLDECVALVGATFPDAEHVIYEEFASDIKMIDIKVRSRDTVQFERLLDVLGLPPVGHQGKIRGLAAGARMPHEVLIPPDYVTDMGKPRPVHEEEKHEPLPKITRRRPKSATEALGDE